MREEETKNSIEEEASAAFFQPLQGEWTRSDQEALESRLAADPQYASAYRRVGQAWIALDTHAESPQLLARRQEAIAYARQMGARQWLRSNRYTHAPWKAAAAVVGLAALLAVVWQLSPYGHHPGQYRTEIGEQRLVELADHSRIVMDAGTALQVRYSADGRVIELERGQAQFSVARDPLRPFKVIAGSHTIVALGTIFTVDLSGEQMYVAMMEGRVAVLPKVAAHSFNPQSSNFLLRPPVPVSSAAAPGVQPQRANIDTAAYEGGIELSVGEGLSVGQSGRLVVKSNADIEAATAWREGRVILNGERLSDAVKRLNRYSHVQIEVVDQTLGSQEISGIFEAGDTEGFIRDIQRYLPVVAEAAGVDKVRLRTR